MKTFEPKSVHPLKNEDGAFDLPSIITGVIVVGVLAAGVLGAVFVVIPYAQDNGAKQDLSAVSTAQGVSKAQAGTYYSLAGLASGGRLPEGLEPLKIDAKRTVTGGWAAAAKSDSGKVYLATESAPTPRDVTGQESCPVFDLLTSPALFEVLEEPAHDSSVGSLPAGKHSWYVTATDSAGGETTPSAVPYVTDLVGNSAVRLTIGDMPNAEGYKIYRSATGDLADARLIDVLGKPAFLNTDEEHGQVWDYLDIGSITPGTEAPPTVNTAVVDPATAYGRLATPELVGSGPMTDWDGSAMPSYLAPGTYSWYVSAIGPSGGGETTVSTNPIVTTGGAVYATFRAVPTAWGYKVYRSATGDPADAKMLRIMSADETYDDGEHDRVWGFADDGSQPLSDDSPSPVNSTIAPAPECAVITDVASALASQR